MHDIKPKFHPVNFIGNALDTAFSQGVKHWLGSDCTVTDAWFVSFPKYSRKIVLVEIKLDDGRSHFSLALGQYLLFKELHKRDIETLYIFQSDPDNLEVLYWWLDPDKSLEEIRAPYKYLLLQREVCMTYSLRLVKAVMLRRILIDNCKICHHQKGLPAYSGCECSCHH